MATEQPRIKTLDQILRETFEAGIRVGCRYPELAAIPLEELDIQFAAHKADLRGDTWQLRDWQQARRSQRRDQIVRVVGEEER